MKKQWMAVALLMTCGALAQSQTTYHVARRIRIGGEGGWDYLVADPAMHRLFLSRSTHVMVLDTERDSVIFDIPNTPGVHGVALAPQLGRGFTSNGRDSTVTIFDYKTLATIATIRIPGANPDAIIFEPTTRRVFTFNGRSNDATAIDGATGAVVGTIPLGGKPEAANFDKGIVYVNIEDDSGKVAAFDATSLAVKHVWNVPGCATPTGQGIDRAHTLLFLACGNSAMAVVDYSTGRVVATLKIGRGTDGAAFDSSQSLAFSTNGGDGTVTVVRMDAPDRFTVMGNVETMRGARTIAYDPGSRRVYTVSAEFGPAPAPTPERPRPRGPLIPGSFTVLVLEP